MGEKDHLFELFLQAQDKYKIAEEAFEEYFVWLEDALAAAKQSFAHTHQVLLPKTPAAKKRGRPKVTEAVDSDDGESSSKRSMTETTSIDYPPPRRGRAASRIAQERVAKSFKESAKRKLRRPSTPEDARTVKKTKSTKQLEKSQDYEVDECSIEAEEVINRCSIEANERHSIEAKKAEKKLTSEVKVVLNRCSSETKEDDIRDELENENILHNSVVYKTECEDKIIGSKKESTVNDESLITEQTPKKQHMSNKRNSSIGKKLKFTSSDEEVVTREKNCNPNDRIDEVEKCESPVNKQINIRHKSGSLTSTVTRDSGIDECIEEVNSRKNMIEVSDTSQLRDDTVISTKSVKNSLVLGIPEVEDENVDVSAHLEPIPKVRSVRTKQKNVESSPNHPVPKPRTTRTKQRIDSQIDPCTNKSGNDVDMLPPQETLKVRSTRTKRKENDSVTVTNFDSSTAKLEVANEPSASDTESITEVNVSLHSTDSFVPPEAPKMRSTRTKKKQMVDSNSEEMESDEPKPRSTRTKKRAEESSNSETDNRDNVMEGENMSDTSSRSTRTKKRQAENDVKQSSRSTRTKRKKYEEEIIGESDKENPSHLDNYPCSPGSEAARLIKKYQSFTEKIPTSVIEKSLVNTAGDKGIKNQRLTRSKIRQVPVSKVTPKKDSPFSVRNCQSPATKRDYQRECCSPRSESGTPKNMKIVSRIGSPMRYSPRPNNSGIVNKAPFQKEALKEVEEIPSNQIEVARSPVRITRHSGGKAVKRDSSTVRCARKSLKRAKQIALRLSMERVETPDSRWARINPQPRTPSPQCPPDKVIRPKAGQLPSGNSTFGSSGRITPKTYSRILPGLMSGSSSSTEYRKTHKKMNTPTEINRTKNVGNIVTSVTSFIKVQAPKPTREDIEAKKQSEIQKKREREEEIRKKKEELLKNKVEEQKRRNEERMKRAKEAREQNERKAEEAKELQRAERRQREERLREEQKKKQLLLAKKKAEEECKARKMREQMEEEKRRLEERLADEVRKAEEAKRIEEERLAEKQRLQEEERRKKRVAEVERIAREKKELEQLKLREAERLAAAKKQAASHKANPKHNETFNVESPENKDVNSTFTLTPANNSGKKTPSNVKMPNPNNYDINDIKSDDSTDDESAPKKVLPTWGQGTHLKMSIINQEYYPPDVMSIFPPEDLLTMPDLMDIFPIVRRRFLKRTSSAIWTTPPHKLID